MTDHPSARVQALGEAGLDLSGEVIPAGMKRWHGGDAPPTDWDGGPVLLRIGGVTDVPFRAPVLSNPWPHSTEHPKGDIIAYTPAPIPRGELGTRPACDDNVTHDWVLVPREPTEAMLWAGEIPIADVAEDHRPHGIIWAQDGLATARIYAAMIAASPSLSASSLRGEGWRTMDSAPRDASRILIATPNGRVCEAWWAHDYEGGPGYWSTPPSPAGRGYTILPDYPTHWMRLPTHPNVDTDGRDHTGDSL